MLGGLAGALATISPLGSIHIYLTFFFFAPLMHVSGGDIFTTNATLAGAVELAGSICGGLLRIDVAQILNSLKIGYSSVDASLDNVPPFIGSIVTTVTTQLSTLMKADLINTIEPVLRPIIQQQLAEAATFAPVHVIPANLGLVRNDFSRRFQGLVNGTSQILGLSEESP